MGPTNLSTKRQRIAELARTKRGDGAVLAAPRHRPGMDEGGVPADAQGWCARHRRRDGGGLRGEPGGQLLDLLERIKSGRYRRAAGAPGIHSQGGRLAAAARHSDLRGQGGAAGDRHGAGGRSTSRTFCPARTASGRGARRIRRCAHCGRPSWAKGLHWVLDVDIRKYFDTIQHSSSACVPRPDESRTASSDG